MRMLGNMNRSNVLGTITEDDNATSPTISDTILSSTTSFRETSADTTAFVAPSTPMSIMTMATICTNVSCKQAILHINGSLTSGDEMTGKDASWILTSAVIIFTMQTGRSRQSPIYYLWSRLFSLCFR